MGIVIPFEVVRQDKPDTEAELRIQEKEAIYRGLILQEAQRKGISFEEEKVITDAMAERVQGEEPDLDEMVAREKGISVYEAKLDDRIEFLTLWNKVFAPHIKNGSDTVPALA